MKYVRTVTGFVTWPKNMPHMHRDIGMVVGRRNIISAGFFVVDSDKEEPEVICYGRSESLDVDSKPEDGELLKQQLFGV